MKAILLFSHGSLLCGSGEALLAHAARLRERKLAPIVEVGYLNYSEPLFEAAVESCLTQGASEIIVAPYFLVPGKFVRIDLPKAILKQQERHPELLFRIAAPLGYDDVLNDAVLASAAGAQPALAWRRPLQQATAHCRALPECPLFSTAECPQSAVRDEAITVRWPASAVETYPASDSALLILAHGSPRSGANEDLLRIVQNLRISGSYRHVQEGFLECNTPDIPAAIDLCVLAGVKSIRTVPYFLHTGTHVAEDLPLFLEAGQQRHPEIEFLMGSYLGASPILTDILVARIIAALNSHD